MNSGRVYVLILAIGFGRMEVGIVFEIEIEKK